MSLVKVTSPDGGACAVAARAATSGSNASPLAKASTRGERDVGITASSGVSYIHPESAEIYGRLRRIPRATLSLQRVHRVAAAASAGPRRPGAAAHPALLRPPRL